MLNLLQVLSPPKLRAGITRISGNPVNVVRTNDDPPSVVRDCKSLSSKVQRCLNRPKSLMCGEVVQMDRPLELGGGNNATSPTSRELTDGGCLVPHNL